MIATGEHKGLKAKVCFADENFVKVELLAKDIKIQLPRTAVREIIDPTQSLSSFGTAGFMDTNPMSFEEAGKQDMGAAFLAQQYGMSGDPRLAGGARSRAAADFLKGGTTMGYGKIYSFS
jgi:hypothetical protein